MAVYIFKTSRLFFYSHRFMSREHTTNSVCTSNIIRIIVKLQTGEIMRRQSWLVEQNVSLLVWLIFSAERRLFGILIGAGAVLNGSSRATKLLCCRHPMLFTIRNIGV